MHTRNVCNQVSSSRAAVYSLGERFSRSPTFQLWIQQEGGGVLEKVEQFLQRLEEAPTAVSDSPGEESQSFSGHSSDSLEADTTTELTARDDLDFTDKLWTFLKGRPTTR